MFHSIPSHVQSFELEDTLLTHEHLFHNQRQLIVLLSSSQGVGYLSQHHVYSASGVGMSRLRSYRDTYCHMKITFPQNVYQRGTDLFSSCLYVKYMKKIRGSVFSFTFKKGFFSTFYTGGAKGEIFSRGNSFSFV